MWYNDSKEKTSDYLERSEKLRGYSTLLGYVKQYRKEGSELKEAIDKAIRRCIDEGVLSDFLRKNSSEVMRMLYNEITSEEFAEIRAKEAYGKGVEAGIGQGRCEGLDAGLEKGATGLIDAYQEMGLSREDARKKLEDKLSLSEEAAERYMAKFWK